MAEPLLELQSICKRFPGVVALSNVSLGLERGEVIALIGENGAGKSTLMKILGGVFHADEGVVLFDGKPVSIRRVADAIGLGIGFIHQELNNLDNLDIAGNVYLGREPRLAGVLVDQKRMVQDAQVYLRRLGLDVPADTPMRRLSLAQQQLVEIAKALSLNARVIIMDEPTSSLTLAETDRLLATVKELRSEGVSIIYISHRLGEIKGIADRVVGLRDGRNAGELAGSRITHDNMVSMMIGRELSAMYLGSDGKPQPARLEVRDLRTRAHPGCAVSFEARAGEILAFAGLVGAGRSELAQAIFGVEPPLSGEICLDGRALRLRGSRDAIRQGIYLAPEDRRKTGLITEMTVRENITLPGIWRHALFGLIRRGSEVRTSKEQIASLRVKTPGTETQVRNLSGGNQQKVVLGKWLALSPRVIILDEPTRGIDIGAKAEIYRLMRDLAERGVIVIMISSDMEEVLGVSDRIAVMHEGRISGMLDDRKLFSAEAVMHLAVGATTDSGRHLS